MIDFTLDVRNSLAAFGGKNYAGVAGKAWACVKHDRKLDRIAKKRGWK